MHTKNEALHKAIKENKVLIAAHRGTNGGNIVQNTSLAYENALLHGADIIEVDVIKSTDGIFYAFHNGEEKVVLGIEEDIRTLSSKEIELLFTQNTSGKKISQKLEKLDDILDKFQHRCFINIDRSWFYWDEIIEYLQKKNMKEKIILKSHVEEVLLKKLEQSKSNIMYMPILKEKEDWNIVNQYDINLVAVELIFDSKNHWFVSKEFMNELKKRNLYAWVNAITLDDEHNLSGNMDDNGAIANGFDDNWGQLIELGFTMIQTDWPALLKRYIQDKIGE